MTTIQLDYAELSTVLAALRTAQEHRAAFEQMPHFVDVEPLIDDAIDELCERINCEDSEPRYTLDEARAKIEAERFEGIKAAAARRRERNGR